MEYAIIVSKQVLTMFILILVGVVCYKTNIITKDSAKNLSSFVLKVVNSAFIFMSFQTELSYDRLKGLIMAFVLSILAHFLLIIFAKLIIKKNPQNEYIIERFSCIYSNCGFMGIPLIEGVFGTEGVLYATAYLTTFNVFVWSHGVLMMKNSFSKKEVLKILKTPAIIAVTVGIICYVTNLRFSNIITRPIEYIGSMNTPLAMVVSGITIAQADFLKIFKNLRVFKISLLRLFVLPAIVILILSFIPTENIIFMSVMLTACCPVATIGTLFAVEYDKNAIYAAEIFSVSTILSLISLPVMILYMNIFS